MLLFFLCLCLFFFSATFVCFAAVAATMSQVYSACICDEMMKIANTVRRADVLGVLT